jgi:lysozyme
VKTSQVGIDLIKGFEGYVGRPYLCPAGKNTIGYGHVIQPGEKFTTLTEPEALALLAKDLVRYEEAVDDFVTVPLTQPQFDALVSFTYSCGVGALLKSTLRKKLNAGDYAGAAEEFLKWCHAGPQVLNGLLVRRKAEQALFLSQGDAA